MLPTLRCEAVRAEERARLDGIPSPGGRQAFGFTTIAAALRAVRGKCFRLHAEPASNAKLHTEMRTVDPGVDDVHVNAVFRLGGLQYPNIQYPGP